MTNPYRGNTGLGSYFLTSASYQKIAVFQTDGMAGLMVDVLFRYRDQGKYLLHEFVIMPDHIHLLLTPTDTVEGDAVDQGRVFLSGEERTGSLRGDLGNHFYDRRVRDWKEYCQFREYIHFNPVKARRSETPEGYRHSSAAGGFVLDALPQRLESAS